MALNDRPLNEAGDALVLSEAQDEFIEWLVDPERKGSQNQFARDHGIDPSTLTKWKKDWSFKDAWDKRLAELNVRPDRIQKIVEAMYNAATGTGPQAVKAMELYLRYVDRFTPKEEVVTSTSVRDLSDDEISRAAENAGFLRVVPDVASSTFEIEPLEGETRRQAAVRQILA